MMVKTRICSNNPIQHLPKEENNDNIKDNFVVKIENEDVEEDVDVAGPSHKKVDM